jgi:hypothetical protein
LLAYRSTSRGICTPGYDDHLHGTEEIFTSSTRPELGKSMQIRQATYSSDV